MVLTSMLTGTRYPMAHYEDPYVVVQRALKRSLHNAAMEDPTPLRVRLDVREDADAFHVTADLPGLTEKEVEVTFDEGLLTIRGEKKLERDEKKETWHITERTTGAFARQLAMPTNIIADKIDATFEKGVLKITMPKTPPEQTTSKKIDIKAG